MSKADKMFEKIGYDKTSDKNTIVFLKCWGNYDEQSGFEEWSSFTFYLDDRTFSADETYESKNITIDEYKAVAEKLKELGWHD